MAQDFLKEKEFSISLAVFVFCLAILISGSWFLSSKIASSSARLKEKKAEIEATYQDWRNLSQSKKELLKIKIDLEKINGAFILLGTPYNFINSLDEIVKKTASSYEINVVTLGETGQDKEKALTFQVKFIGNFNNFMHFLQYLENMKYYTKVESVQIDKIKEEEAAIKVGSKNLSPGSIQGLVTLKAFAI